MASKLFSYNAFIDETGIVGGNRDGFFEISGLDKIRVVIENAAGGNIFTFRVKIKGQTTATTLTTITGNANTLIDIKTYDALQIDCTTFGGGNIRFSSTGFKIGSSEVEEVPTFGDLPAPTGSAELKWVTADAALYYDEPTSESWKTSTATNASLTSTYVGYGSGTNSLAGKSTFTFNDSTDTLNVSNLEVAGTAILTVLYKPEEVYTIAGADVTNKFVTLSSTPTDPSRTRLAVESGPQQVYGVDFTVVGNQLGWNGLGLDGLLEVGDQIMITFN